jgi:hypothetical protein
VINMSTDISTSVASPITPKNPAPSMEDGALHVDAVYSPDYDHEVIFAEMLVINVDDLPEFEPQIRPAHFPTT